MINQKEYEIVNYFINNPTKYISEISIELNIPSSTIQRYLKKNKDRKTINNTSIEEQLKINKARGNKKGGDNSFESNEFLKDNKGRFIGSQKNNNNNKNINSNKIQKKEKDIKLISKYYLENKNLSLEELTEIFKSIGSYTKSYIYDCLTSNRTKEILDKDTYQEIQENLRKNSNPEERNKNNDKKRLYSYPVLQ